jgi:hypothetical protein
VAERGWCLRAEEYLAITVATACLPVAAPIACSAADRCRVACRCMCECLWYSGRPTLGDGVTVRADGVRLWPVGWLVVVSCMGLGHMTTCIKKFLGILSIQRIHLHTPGVAISQPHGSASGAWLSSRRAAHAVPGVVHEVGGGRRNGAWR